MRWRDCKAASYQDPPSPRLGHTAVLVDARGSWGEDLLVIYGGLNGDKQPLGDLLVLQTASEAWLQPATSNQGPPPRAFHCAAAIGGSVYIFGGHVFLKDNKGMQKFNDLWRLNTDNWEWSAVKLPQDSPQPSPRDFLSMVDLPGGKLLIFGGLEINEKRSDETWMFDTSEGAWSELSLPMPRPKARYAHTLVRVEQRVLMFGGGGETATTMLNDLWILKGAVAFEDAEPCWVPLEVPGPVPPPRKAHTMAAVGWQVVVFGGHASELGWFRTKTEHYFNDLAILDRQNAVQWRTANTEGELPPGREFHTLTTVSPSRLLLFGGGNGKSIFSDAWWLCLDEDASPTAQSTRAPPIQGAAFMDLNKKQAPGGAGNALSEMSEASTLPEPLSLDAADLATDQPRATRSSMALSEQSASHKHWWAGSPDAENFLQLLKRLQIPVGPSNQGWGPSLEGQHFQQLSKQLSSDQPGNGLGAPPQDTAQSATLETKKAREYVVSTAPERLRLRDIEALMWDYRRCWKSQPSNASDGKSLDKALEHLTQGNSHRFSHMQRHLQSDGFCLLPEAKQAQVERAQKAAS